MTRIDGLKPAVILGIALVAFAIGLTGAGPLSPREEPAKAAPLVTTVDPAACAADEAAVASIVNASGLVLEPAAPGGCKACKDRPWCGCSYQGHPRISCNPCCYQAYPYPICLD